MITSMNNVSIITFITNKLEIILFFFYYSNKKKKRFLPISNKLDRPEFFSLFKKW